MHSSHPFDAYLQSSLWLADPGEKCWSGGYAGAHHGDEEHGEGGERVRGELPGDGTPLMIEP